MPLISAQQTHWFGGCTCCVGATAVVAGMEGIGMTEEGMTGPLLAECISGHRSVHRRHGQMPCSTPALPCNLPDRPLLSQV